MTPSSAREPIRVPLPTLARTSFWVYCQSRPSLTLEPAHLRETALEWLEYRSDDPLRSQVRRWIEGGKLSIEVLKKARFPSGLGSGAAAQARFRASDLLVKICARDRLAPPRPGLWAALAAARATAALWQGLVYDPAASHFHAPESRDHRLPAGGEIAVADHIILLRSVDERGLGWITTKGLRRFCLAELEIRDAPPDLGAGLSALLHGAA